MDEPDGSSSPAATGNVAIPEWMLKRRARQAHAAAPNPAADTGDRHAIPPDTPPSPVFDYEPEVTAAIDVTPLRREPPPWFRAKQAIASQAAPATTSTSVESDSTPDESEIDDTGVALPPIAAEEADPLEWHAELRERWLGKQALRSYAISIFMHILIALPLSIVVFHEELTQLGIETLMAVQGEEWSAEALDETPVVQLDTSGGANSDNLEKVLSASVVSNAFAPSSLNVDDISAIGKGDGEGSGDDVGNGLNIGGYKMPAGGKAVNKGSFTAWTVPEDPAPGEDYKIVIQVKYKQRNLKIPKGDITGSVIGTDKFRLMISPHTSEVIAESNQVVIQVPGAMARVRDTIRVYSAVLKENQRLEIVF